jgi:hypothetical protein
MPLYEELHGTSALEETAKLLAWDERFAAAAREQPALLARTLREIFKLQGATLGGYSARYITEAVEKTLVGMPRETRTVLEILNDAVSRGSLVRSSATKAGHGANFDCGRVLDALKEVVGRIRLPRGKMKFADIGLGSGPSYSVSSAKRFNGWSYRGFDPTVSAALRLLQSQRFDCDIRFIAPFHAYKDELPGKYFIIKMTAVMHSIPPEGRPAQIERVARHLYEGGFLILGGQYRDSWHLFSDRGQPRKSIAEGNMYFKAFVKWGRVLHRIDLRKFAEFLAERAGKEKGNQALFGYYLGLLDGFVSENPDPLELGEGARFPTDWEGHFRAFEDEKGTPKSKRDAINFREGCALHMRRHVLPTTGDIRALMEAVSKAKAGARDVDLTNPDTLRRLVGPIGLGKATAEASKRFATRDYSKLLDE